MNKMFMTMSGSEVGVVIVLVIVLVCCGVFFTKMIIKQRKEIKELEATAKARSEARRERRRK